MLDAKEGMVEKLLSRDLLRLRRNVLPLILMVVGAALVLYVGAQYAQMYLEQRSLAREWERQQTTLLQPQPNQPPVPRGLTRLAIPRINLDAIVVEGATRHDLLLGPGHIKGTAEPGELGNVVITGHRDTFFRHIHELGKGDVVLVQRNGKTYRYEVTAKKIVDPEDVSVVRPSKDNRLTLITCYPTYYIGPAPDRLVVFTKMVDQTGTSGLVKTAQAASPVQTAK
jgi:sortase A